MVLVLAIVPAIGFLGALKENLSLIRIYFIICIMTEIITIISLLFVPSQLMPRMILNFIMNILWIYLVYYFRRDLSTIREQQENAQQMVPLFGPSKV